MRKSSEETIDERIASCRACIDRMSYYIRDVQAELNGLIIQKYKEEQANEQSSSSNT